MSHQSPQDCSARMVRMVQMARHPPLRHPAVADPVGGISGVIHVKEYPLYVISDNTLRDAAEILRGEGMLYILSTY